MKKTDWTLYIVSTEDGALYTGITTDLARRLKQHRQELAGGAKFFRRSPLAALLYQEKHADRRSASQREYAIKQLSKQQKLKLINDKTAS
ncbi:Excinuclease ABC, C subunit [Methylophaga frappieri]|uniref:Excinuclease ABC, C subunit n=1 Tax=Methylophaga frappieri (strain ATCC BAA-2434 / DSM 25690 / JAM7) TaxID=754477 RepID=I1YGC8_METFJ|nr:GIY-YIG nuclease family protein [Methylophaga frappieri]AFJ01971.1 Excinuclease ABC, C subunit [Methylophaga frappieri]